MAHMERTYKFRIYPTKVQSSTLDHQIGLCQRLYNCGLEHRITAYRNGESVSYYDQQNELPAIKEAMPEYKDIYSHAAQDALRRLDRAYQNFFRRVKKGEKPGFPRFRGRNRYRSITFDRYGFRLLDNGHVNITKIGDVRMFRHREIDGEPKTCIIKRDDVGDWYATISVTQPDPTPVEPEAAVGVDVGLESLATLSTGETITRHRFIKESEEKIKILQRRVSRKKKGSGNRRKAVEKLAKAHRRVQRQRDDYLHKASRSLVDSADVVVFENLRIRNMQKNHHLAQSISDSAWGKLMQYTVSKAEEAGKHVYFVDPSGTSQQCARCGATVRKSLSERFHVCQCGFSTGRDLNAALNILGRLPADSGELLKTPAEAEPLCTEAIGGGA